MSHNAPSRPPCIVVAGVSGTGKTTVALLLAERLGVPFAEADDLHTPASIAKMSAGVPLDDSDRSPWLESIGSWLHEREAAGTGGVIACSALKRKYRDALRVDCPSVYFLHLTADPGLLARRLSRRTRHFMPESLLDSQLAALEPVAPDEPGATLDAAPPPGDIADTALGLLPGQAGEHRG
ncbi:gluconokinase [Streptomyces sp. NPDC017448]|uniref:gluconokinase n=1 Tax=Streptomyces sp. NPDC017448 TaxID=3364996 RepID=UPI00379D194E